MSNQKLISMPRRILFFCGASYVFGKEIVTLNLIRELRDKGVIVHCIVSGWNNGDFTQRLNYEKIPYDEVKLGFFYLNKPLWTLDSLVHYPGALIKLRKIINIFKPDIYYFNSERTMSSVYPLMFGKKVLLHLHEPIENSRLNNIILQRFPGNKITYVACSKFVLNKLSSLIDIDVEDAHVIYNSIEIKKRVLNPPAGRDKLHIGVIGQLMEHKGQDVLLRALGKLSEYNFTCSIYGSGSELYEKKLKDIAVNCGISSQIIFKGFEKDINRIYSDLDIVVVPSRFSEPFGLVAIEPAQWEIPVVVSNMGGLTEVVEDGISGLVFENEDVDDLVDKLLLLFNNESLRVQLGANAFKRAKKLFSTNTMGNAFIEII